jgi:hypothetical protein
MLSAGNKTPHCRGTPNGDLGDFFHIRPFALEIYSPLEGVGILSMHNADGWLPIHFRELVVYHSLGLLMVTTFLFATIERMTERRRKYTICSMISTLLHSASGLDGFCYDSTSNSGSRKTCAPLDIRKAAGSFLPALGR